MSFTNYLAAELLDHLFTDGAYSPPATLYIALSTTTPTEAGGNFTEPSDGYDRKSVAAADMDAATVADPSVKDNGAELAFPQATGSWGTVTYFGIYDAATAGNLTLAGALSASKTIDNGDTAKFEAGDMDITLD